MSFVVLVECTLILFPQAKQKGADAIARQKDLAASLAGSISERAMLHRGCPLTNIAGRSESQARRSEIPLTKKSPSE